MGDDVAVPDITLSNRCFSFPSFKVFFVVLPCVSCVGVSIFVSSGSILTLAILLSVMYYVHGLFLGLLLVFFACMHVSL